jgi:hypothetical protein
MGRIAVCANLGHSSLALESSADSVINTLWFPPVLLDALVAVGLVTPGARSMNEIVSGVVYTLEARRAFLYNFNGGRHGVLLKVVNDQVFRIQSPSDECEVHPTIPTTRPPTCWDQSTRN